MQVATFAKKLHRVWSKNHAVSSKSVRPWQWSDKAKFEVRDHHHWSENTAVRRLSLLKLPAEVSHQATKTNWNKAKYHGYPTLPEVFETDTGSAVEKHLHTYVPA